MGYMRHHAIIVTSWDKKSILDLHGKAQNLFGSNISEIVQSDINGYTSFFVPPDGSKEGWPDSVYGDEKRKLFIKMINDIKYDDGSNSVRYVEVFYGDDEENAQIVNHN